MSSNDQNRNKPEYEIFLQDSAADILKNDKHELNQVVQYLIQPLCDFFNDDDNIFELYQEGCGIQLAEIHMESLIKKLNENIINLTRAYSTLKDWNFPSGEKFFVRHINIHRYMARNYLLIKDFPERFNFVVDRYEHIIPINQWNNYDFGIENNGKIYLVKEYDTAEILENIIPFIRIKKLPDYKHHLLYTQNIFGGSKWNKSGQQTYLWNKTGL